MQQQPNEEKRRKEFAEVVAIYKRAAASGLREEIRVGGRRVCTVVPPSRRHEDAENSPQS